MTTATTGPDGRFVARGVGLNVDAFPATEVQQGRSRSPRPLPGFGLTWHELVRVRPAERRSPDRSQPDATEREAFYQGEPIQVDLAFDHPATVRGRLVNDLGRPLAGVKVQVGVCDDISRSRRLDGGKIWSCVRLDPTDTVVPRSPVLRMHRLDARGPPLDPHPARRHLPDRWPAPRGPVPRA